jgi:hypothetical protein
VAGYTAKYCVKATEALGLPQRRIEDDEDIDALEAPEHVRRLVWACCVLSRRRDMAGLRLRERAHGLGFGGHFLTKSRRYSTTMGALRKVRRDQVRRQLSNDGIVLDAGGPPGGQRLGGGRADLAVRRLGLPQPRGSLDGRRGRGEGTGAGRSPERN